MKLFALSLFALALPLAAHHSFAAEYDSTKPLKVTGAVTKVDWANPHVYFYVDVKDAETGRVLSVSDEPATKEYCTDFKSSPTGKQFGQKTDASVAIRDAVTGKEVRSLLMPSKTVSGGLVWSRSGRLLAANSSKISIWNTMSGELVSALDSVEAPLGFQHPCRP